MLRTTVGTMRRCSSKKDLCENNTLSVHFKRKCEKTNKTKNKQQQQRKKVKRTEERKGKKKNERTNEQCPMRASSMTPTNGRTSLCLNKTKQNKTKSNQTNKTNVTLPSSYDRTAGRIQLCRLCSLCRSTSTRENKFGSTARFK